MRTISKQKSQSGFVLMLTLVFLIVLTILGLAASGTTAIETLMARNFRDRDTAFAAAELGLRDAELRISGYYANPATPINVYGFPDKGADPACKTGGLCVDSKNRGDYPGTMPTPPEDQDFFASDSLAQEMGDWTASANKTQDISGLAAQPRHMIEQVCRKRPGDSVSGNCQYIYRITVQAQGKLASSRVTLQETYVP